MLDRSFCDGVLRAMGRVQREREVRDTCPNCARADALCSVSKHGAKLGKFCPHCRWISSGLAKAAGVFSDGPPKRPSSAKVTKPKKSAAKRAR